LIDQSKNYLNNQKTKGFAMSINSSEHEGHQMPRWLTKLLPLIATVVGAGALWIAWFQYIGIMDQPQSEWYAWIRPVLMSLVGLLCMMAAILFMTAKPSAWSVFVGGLSIIPIMLFSNLVILIFRVIQNIMLGDVDPFLSRVSSSPLKVILNIMVVLIVLSVIQGIKKSKNDN
jgi:hypothetical protein